jgi:hypothetical protein
MLIHCGNPTPATWWRFARGQTIVQGLCRLPDLALIPLGAPVSMAVRQLGASARLLAARRRFSGDLPRALGALAAADCLTQETMLTGLTYWIGRAAARTWHPAAFLTLYEGHAWEACLRRGVKSVDPRCRTIGYQHTAIFPESLALTAPTGERNGWAVPDVVLGLGRIPIALMQPGHDALGTPMIRFGGFRCADGGADTIADPGRRTVLVTPEGIPSEVRALFRMAADCAARLPAYTFVLRCHPQIPMQAAAALAGLAPGARPNVVLSEGRSLEQDCARASVLMYRGSSTALHAVLHGLLPVAMSTPEDPAPDPLYWLQGWRERCASPEQFAACVEAHAHAPREQLEAAWRRAVRDIRGYLEPVCGESIDKLIAAAMPTGRSRSCGA